MSAEGRQTTTYWAFGGIAIFIALLLLGFNLWFRFFQLGTVEDDLKREKTKLDQLVAEQSSYYDAKVKDILNRYSDGMYGVQSVFAARDEVFSGVVGSEDEDPVVLFDYLDFFGKLRDLLSNKVLISNLSISRAGAISFLIETTSYRLAADQIAAFRFGFAEETLSAPSSDGSSDEVLEEQEPVPPFLINFEVTSISRDPITGDVEKLPDLLKQSDAIYSFIVQAQINPEYYAYLKELQDLQEELADEAAADGKNKDNSDTSSSQ